MNHLVTFCDSQMSTSAALCMSSALLHGVNTARLDTPESISGWSIVKAHPEVFRQPEDPRRAWAWWAWKPLIIQATMQIAAPNDVIIYSDAGIEFIENVREIVDRMDQHIFLFGNMWPHFAWCKADIIEAIWPHREGFPITDIYRTDEETEDYNLRCPWFHFKKQIQASVIFFRVSDYTRAFVKEWLDWCLFENGRLIDDSPSRAPNHPEFQENRHDQAILTTMAYRDAIKLHYWPAVYGDGRFPYERDGYPDEGYPAMWVHHRKRNHEWSSAA